MANEISRNNRFQILSFSGGGYLGLYSASIIERLEEEAGRPLAQCFDLIAGTSIGGIIALGLALEVPAKSIVESFKKYGKNIFSSRKKPNGPLHSWIDLCYFLFGAKYKSDGLREAIEAIVGKTTKIEDVLHPVIVPAVNVTAGKPQFFKTPHHSTFSSDYKLKIVDVALATSAAPTIFPLAKVGNSFFADGGLYVNLPDMAALHEATYFMNANHNDINVLSIGTTNSQFSFSHATDSNMGLLAWGREMRILSVLSSAQQQCDRHMIAHMLEERYFRIDREQSSEQQKDLALDVATSEVQGMLQALGNESAKESLGDARMSAILNHCPPSPIFFHGIRKNSKE